GSVGRWPAVREPLRLGGRDQGRENLRNPRVHGQPLRRRVVREGREPMSETGLNEARLAHLRTVIEADVKRRLYHGAVIIVARNGHIGLQASIGSADEQQTRPLQTSSVFSIFSAPKAL